MAMKNGSYTNRAHVSSHFDKEGSYWLSQLSGDLVKSCFPYDYPEKVVGKIEIEPGREPVKGTISGELFQKLMKLSGSSDPKLHIILAVGLMTLLNRYTGNTDIIVGTPIYKPEKEGQYINTVLALRNHVDRQMSFKNLLVEVRKTVIEAVEHANLPINTLLYQLGLPGSPNDFPLFDIAILLENIQDKRHIQHVRPRMVFSFKRTRQCLEGTVEYSASLYEKETIERILSHFIRLLQHGLGDVDLMISKIDLLSGSEKERLLFDLNRTQREYPKSKTIHQLFQQQVEKAPDHAAVIYGEEHFTYKELNGRANRLARVLKKKGVHRDTLVGVMLERSFDFIVGILAVLKAGGAYVPFDPDTPRERITAILNDCRTSILLLSADVFDKYRVMTLQGPESTPTRPYVSAARPQIKDLDRLPLPNRSLVDYEKFNRYIGITMATNKIALQASRGCPYNCAYCHKIWPKTHVFRSAEHIFSEVRLYYDMGIKRFAFIDDIFNLDTKNTMRFFEMIVKNRMDVKFFFPNGIRGDIMTREYIDLMVEAGTINLAFALETASPRLQKLIGKNLKLNKFRENIEYFAQKYPQVMLDIFTMVGFPTETEEEAMMTLDFVKSIHWLHFPAVATLRIYPNTNMERLALENGISREAVDRSLNLAYHELPETLPFDKTFMLEFQTRYLDEYFLNKERLLYVLPQQMKVLTENEIVQKYDSYLDMKIRSFDGILDLAGIKKSELSRQHCLSPELISTPGLNGKMKEHFVTERPDEDAFKILLLDLSQWFTDESHSIYNVVEPPLGLMNLMTYLTQEHGSRIEGKVAKSRIDFDSYPQLKAILDEFKPGIIGIRTLTFYKKFFHRTVAMIRRWGIDVPIITGGPYATSSYAEILQDANVDLVVMSEGEITFNELMGKILDNNGKLPDESVLREIKGVAFIPGKIAGQTGAARELILMDGLVDELPNESPGNFEHINEPGDLAYTMYTSGSTGKPKGVMIPHQGVVNYIYWAAGNYVQDETVNFPLYSSPSFDMTVTSIFTPLLTGNAVHIYGGEHTEILIEKVVEENRTDVVKATPSHLKLIKDRKIEKNASRIKRFIVGGEELETSLAAQITGNFGKNVEIYNEYGPTETVVGCMIYKYDFEKNKQTAVPIGVPIANSQIYILDSNLEPVCVGVAGEIYIGGDGVARGYVNRVELTMEKFLENPFSDGKRIYRSGDLGRWLPDGNVEFLGRIDQQVKIRGFRIELGEIENQLITHKKIEKAVVITANDTTGSKSLAAYFVPSANDRNPPGAIELREYLSARLPDYMIPVYMMEIENIPLTPGGKLDQKSLPEPELKLFGNYIAPGNELEKKLVRIWSDLLGITDRNIGINDNFFQLGGHSLKATFLVSELHKEFDVKIALMEIFRAPTVKGLAEYIRGAVKDRFTAVKPVEMKVYYPQSSAQKRLFFLQQFDQESIAYNMPQTVCLEMEVELEKFRQTFKKLIRRHDSLRTSFEMRDGEGVQRIHDDVEFEMEYFDISGDGIETGGVEAGKIIENFVRPFDLSRAPLLRAGLIKAGAAKYVLMIDMHHMINDDISQGIVVKDFMALYRGEMLSPLRLQYKDFSEWKNRAVQRQAIKNQEVYWLKVFADEVPALNLPADYTRPALQSFEGNTRWSFIAKEEIERLKVLGTKEDATLYMTLLAVFYVFLSKISSNEDIVVGGPVAGRQHKDLQHIVGMFVNMLPMRNQPRGQKSCMEFLREIKQKTLEVFENQDYPVENLLEAVDVGRDRSRNVLFEIVFNFLSRPEQTDAAAGDFDLVREMNPYVYENRTAKFDLMLIVREANDGLVFGFEYCTKLFREKTIERFIEYFKKIFSTVVKNPGRKILEIDILSEEEKNQLLVDFNDTEAAYPKDKTIHELFEEQAAGTPDGVAVVGSRQGAAPPADKEAVGDRGEKVQLTYRELNEKSNRLARYLQSKGVGPETIVGLMVDRSIEMIVGILGILKAGGAYLPIEIGIPGERIRYMLKDSNAGVLVSELSEGSKVSGGIEVVKPGELSKESPAQLTHLTHPTQLCYVIYTSGTTGRPKGVLTTHYNVTRVVRGTNYIDIKPEDRFLQLSNYAFDGSVFDIYGALLNGSALVLIKKDDVLAMERLAEIIKREAITVFFVTTALFNTLVDLDVECLCRIRKVLFGGERASVEHSRNALAYLGKDRVIEVYGPTETTVFATTYSIGSIADKAGTIPIGKPISNTTIYVLDKHLKPVPIGVSGEIYIGGTGNARGYVNSPELTAEKFIYELSAVSCLYKTGDLGCWLPDGNIEFIDRIDHQVKIRGFRIELGEIENNLLLHEEIKEAVVLSKEDSRGTQQFLCAYLVSDNELSTTALREYLSKSLPEYMIPAYFVQMNKIPLTSNGKVDRKALPDPETWRKPGIDYVQPRNVIENKLVDIWSGLLNIEKEMIGIDADFFDLGGHSLKATNLIVRIHEELKVKLPLVEVFQSPTIRQLSQLIEKSEENKYVSIEAAEEREYYVLSSNQKRLYFVQRMAPESTSYNLPMVRVFGVELNKEKLEDIFKKLIRRHESLRTSFENIEEEPVQVIHCFDEVEFAIDYHDLTSGGGESPSPLPEISGGEVGRIIDGFVRPFDLSCTPLLRVGLVRAGKNRNILMLDIHHIITDGISMSIIIEDFWVLYDDGELPQLPLQYKDYSRWWNSEEAGEVVEKQEKYWLKVFAGRLPVLDLSTDYVRPPVQNFEGDSLKFEIGDAITGALNVLAKSRGTTLYTVLLTIFSILLAKISGQEDIVVGTFTSGRNHPNLDRIVGMFANTLALRNYPKLEKTFVQFLGEVKENTLNAFENQDYPFEIMVDTLVQNRRKDRNPIFDVMFGLQNLTERLIPAAETAIPGEQDDFEYENKVSHFDLLLIGVEMSGKLYFVLEYCSKLFKKETIERMIEGYLRIVDIVTANNDIKIKDIDLQNELIPVERVSIDVEFNV